MNSNILNLVLSLIFSFFLFSTAQAAKVVSGDENSVVVAVEKAKNAEKSLSKASKAAEKHCKKHDKVAKLERTEKAGKKDKGAVAYYSCVSQGGESSDEVKADESEESSDAESNE
jgi:hypothetical protein